MMWKLQIFLGWIVCGLIVVACEKSGDSPTNVDHSGDGDEVPTRGGTDSSSAYTDSTLGNNTVLPLVSAFTPIGTLHAMVLVPADSFTMGMTDDQRARISDREWFRHVKTLSPVPVSLDSFYIDKYLVTWDQYAAFLNDVASKVVVYSSGRVQYNDTMVLEALGYLKQVEGKFEVKDATVRAWPMGGTRWGGALAYCHWRGLQLPAEAEWEKAAQGVEESLYPWGDGALDREVTLVNRPVWSMPEYASPYGVENMSVGVSEWTLDVADAVRQTWVVRGGYEPWERLTFFRSESGSSAFNIAFRCAGSVLKVQELISQGN